MLRVHSLLLPIFSLTHQPTTQLSTCLPSHIHDLKRHVKSASLIFSGRLVSVSTVNERGPFSDSVSVSVFKFLPDRVWRGVNKDTIQLKGIPQYDDFSLLTLERKYLFIVEDKGYISQCDPIAKNLDGYFEELDRMFKKRGFKKLQASK